MGDLLAEGVEDEADGRTVHPTAKGSGLALTTLRKRLERQYNGEATLTLAPLERGTVVTVDLPKTTDARGGP